MRFKPYCERMACTAVLTLMLLGVAGGAEPGSLAAGGRHVLMVRGGVLLAAGSHDAGQLGHPGLPVTNLAALVAAPLPREGLTWLAAAAGWRHSLAIASDGSLWACGRNHDGQLGDGTIADRTAWVPVATEHGWTMIAAGERHSLGLRNDGALWSWGWNGARQLGLETAASATTPQRVGEDTGWVPVAPGLTHSAAIRSDGSLWTWGTSGHGALGQGALGESPMPARVGTDADWAQVAAGVRHTLAIKRDGSLWAWGDNAAGQLGTGTRTSHVTPVRVGGDTRWAFIAAGERHSVALAADGQIWLWGANDFGQLGAQPGSGSPVPVPAADDTRWKRVAAGNDFTAAQASDGSLWLWGTMIEPQPDRLVATAPAALDEVSLQQMSALKTQAAAAVLEATSRLGQQPLSQVLAAGERHGAYIRRDGSLWAWGVNDAGQLGDGTMETRVSPVRIAADSGPWSAVAAGERHTVAIRSDGTLWSWGAGDLGQTGQGGGEGSRTPMQVGTGQTWYAVACGAGHTIALQRDGSLWGWGWNWSGQVGDFTTVNVPLPVPVSIGSDKRSAVTDHEWNSIGAGRGHSVALRRDGVWAWGSNESGQLGILVQGKTPDRFSPDKLGLKGAWRQVAPGGEHTLGLDADGSLWAWGDNRSGQLGSGATEGSAKPVKVGRARWKAVAAGGFHSAGIREDGTLWGWGRNAEGQLGFLTAEDEPEPLQIGQDADWESVAAGRAHTMAVKNDGSIWAWGRWSVGEMESGGGAITFGGRVDK